MVIKHTKPQCEPNSVSNKKKISTVHQYEYLGFRIDDKLTMNEYLDVMWKLQNWDLVKN